MEFRFFKFLSALLAVCLMMPYAAPAVSAASALYKERYERVEVWKRTDIVLTSNKSYNNPYLDVEIDAVFTHEDGTRIALYGFWNGGNEWRIRFAPTKTGLWSYTVTCSDTGNPSLHQRTGKILAVENTGTTDLDRHGFVKISDNGRYFTYDDGTPFYWLGDTNWQAPNYVSVTQCNYPGCQCGNQFLHELNDRLAKGFTVYQTYFDSSESDGGGQRDTTPEPSLWLDRYTSVNPETFSQKIDGMFDTLADSGMVIALGIGVHWITPNAMGKENLDRITRYITARYASYPIVWITAQEITGEPQFSLWQSSAEVVDLGDGYNHPQGAHQFPTGVDNSYVEALDRSEWHEFYALQAGHGPTFASKALYEGYWNNERNETPKPFIETEANYEDITCGGFNGYDASRIAAWKANLSGSYGFTYGVTGVWANNYSTSGNLGWYGSFSYEPWYMGIDKPGSFEMTYLRRFFEYVDFSTLIPRFNDKSYSDLTDENKLVASSRDGRTYIAYFYNAGLSTGELRGLNDREHYSAKWYNPLTGRFVEIADEITLKNGVYTIPHKPTTGDWALLVTCRDLGACETEAAYTDVRIDARENLALDGKATVSSDNSGQIRYGAKEAVDGDYSTYWCAQNGDMPQWLILDLGEEKSFAEIDLYLYRGVYSHPMSYASFTVEGSLDGTTYTTIHTSVREAPAQSHNAYLYRMTGKGSYRYLKFSFSEVENNWATIVEIGVYEESAGAIATEKTENIVSGATATASGYTGLDSTPAHAIDGNASSWWCGPGQRDQWIRFDMNKVKSFDTVSFTVYGGTTSLTYTVDTSLDGVNYTTVYTGRADSPSGRAGNSEVYGFVLDHEVSCQYIRINFDYVEGNWATIVELTVTRTPSESDTLPVYDGRVQTPGILSNGSYIYQENGVISDSRTALTDGDPATVWSPFAPIGTQTVIFDLYEAKPVYGIEIHLGRDAVLPPYRLEGSLDGTAWTVLADATLRDGAVYTVEGRSVVSEALAGRYRYVKLLWLNAPGNSDVKTIAEVRLFAQGETSDAPAAVDKTALKAIYDKARILRNGEKNYTTASFRSLTLALVGAAKALMPTATAEDVSGAEAVLTEAYCSLISLLGETGVDYLAYLSKRDNGGNHDIRFVLSADKEALRACNSLTVTVVFDTADGQKSTSYTLNSEGKADFVLCHCISGGGKIYEAIPDHVLFGLVVTDIPDNAWTDVTLTVSDGNTNLYKGTCTYGSLSE